MGEVQGGAAGRLRVPRPGGEGGRIGEGEPGRRGRGLDLTLPSGSGTFGDFSFDSHDYDWSDYRSQMYWAIWRSWMNRLYVMSASFDRWAFQSRARTWQGTVLVRFVIERTGAISLIQVLEPSQMPPLDESARGALKEVILPPLPPDFDKEREGVTGRFTMDIEDASGWKEYMKYQKYRGVF